MTKLEEILQQAQQLSPRERLQLISRLQEETACDDAHVPRRRWREVAGIAPNLMQGVDAQEWLSQSRREADMERERQWTG